MDSSQWPQGIEGLVVRSVESSTAVQKPVVLEKKPRPPREQALNCPRCNSINTKFCYYNNYSLSQPRYFCKNCRRYWTEGGSLRNVPVGGGSRKNKRSSSSASTLASSSTSSSKKLAHDLNPQPSFLSTNPKIQQVHDLNLTYNLNPFLPEFPFGLDVKNLNNTSKGNNHLPSVDLLKPVTFTAGQSSSFMPDNTVYCSSLPVHEHLKSNLGFSLDGLNQNVNGGNLASSSSRLLFPFDELKPVSTANEFGRDEANGYWNGVLDGGSW